MPTSSMLMIPTVLDHLQRLNPDSVLDIGAGYGKYGVLCREYLDRHPHMEAIEAWEPYIVGHRLGGIYDRIHCLDAMQAPKSILNSCDAVLMGDVIEHLAKPDAFTLLDRIHRPIVICTPEQFFSNGPGLPWTETHRSHWTIADFRGTGRLQHADTIHAGHVVTLGPIP